MKSECIPGSRIRDTHRHTVFGILGKDLMIPVTSSGQKFYMVGNFPWRTLADKICEIPPLSPEHLAREIGGGISYPSINIAETPENLTRHTYLALIGGAVHESFHRLYSRQSDLSEQEIAEALQPMRGVDVPWFKYKKLLLDTQNLFEDISIERIGNAEFPGVQGKLENLADFIITQELSSNRAISTVQAVFVLIRELGLGYQTEKSLAYIEMCRTACPQAYQLVTGPLGGILQDAVPAVDSLAAIAKSKSQVLNGKALTLALNLIRTLHTLSVENSENSEEARDLLGGYDQNATRVLDSSAALELAVENELARDRKRYQEGEAPYRPYTTTEDTAKVATNLTRNLKLEKSLRECHVATAYMRSRFACMFQALEEDRGREYGVRTGSKLSDRNLVDTYVELRGGLDPSRAFVADDNAIDMSLAAAIVIDESASMADKLTETASIAYSLGLSLDQVGAKTMIFGFRTGWQRTSATIKDQNSGRYHRCHSVDYDIFKWWGENFRVAAPRLGGVKATGLTPMADGIEYGLRELSARREGHRVLFVLTDGRPDTLHGPVIAAQLRRAREAGIIVLAVGLGPGAEYVVEMFPEHVYSRSLREIPKALIKKLEGMVRTRHSLAKRGMLVRSE